MKTYSCRRAANTALTAFAISAAACSGETSGGSTLNSGANSNASNGSNGDVSGGENLDINGATNGGGGTSDNGATNSNGNFDECASETAEAEGVGLDMYVMLDHTGSMGNDCDLNVNDPPTGNASKWCFASHALARYFMSNEAAGHRAALQFMTVPDYDCQGGPDNGEAQAEVPLTELPVAATDNLITTLDGDGPLGGLGTRIEAALRGISDFTAANRTEGRTMIGILITDGDPQGQGCNNDVTDLAQIPAAHLADTTIKTFFIGMTGASLDNLETMAAEGGAPEHGPDGCDGPATCHYWSVGNGDPEVFAAALNEIQSLAVLPCEYTIPPPPAGEQLNKDLVNVEFSDAAGEAFLPRVDAEAACDAQDGGWFYDDNDAPSTIRLCSASCTSAQASGQGASLRIAYGCETVIR